MQPDVTAADGDEPVDDPTDGESVETDGGRGDPQIHTIQLELPDEPGQLLAALHPVADNGGNLLSVVHERGERTPRGRIPVAIDLECPPERFDGILDGLRETGVTVVTADAEAYADELVVVLVGHLVDTGLSGTLQRLREHAEATVADVTLSAPDADAPEEPSAARVHLRTREGGAERTLEAVRTVAEEKDLTVVEPLGGV
ncbi:MAG: ACT-domain-containing protein, putative allosteric regulator of homoserine dehydrogenase [halophilic archaeon J07HB67]|nr:MAG: ACT-domain-containing protein, putative allosteric regulator of homoserine dehydrogenase [halophilic archaeon J07HB67]